MKQTFLTTVLSTAGALMYFAIVTPTSAGPPDFSICDGLIDDAKGVCRAGVAVGCADGTGNPTACENIEAQFLQVTGTEPPWGTPPSACPCDFEQLAKSLPPWSATDESPLYFVCSTCMRNLTVFVTEDWSTGIGLWQEGPYGYGGYPGYGYPYGGWGGPYGGWGDEGPGASCEAIYSCQTLSDGDEVNYATNLTVEEAEACAQDVIAYAQEFMANNSLPVDDTCTPTLSP